MADAPKVTAEELERLLSPEFPRLFHPETGLAILKVFLIDKDGWVREIYSNQSLDPAAILGDIETLALEEANRAKDRR